MLFRNFDPLFQELDRVSGRVAAGTGGLAYDVVRFEDHVDLVVDVPGVDVDDIELTVDGRELTLAFTRERTTPDGATLVTAGRPHGTVSRRIHLGDTLDADRLEAAYDRGVLTVSIPVSESAKPRRVAIGAGAAAIETTGSD